ncbi:MAG TPA: hypothetical protein VGH37_06660 [Candidatus Acidoferrum sp.]
MKDRTLRQVLQLGVVVCLLLCAGVPLLAAMKNWAIVVAAGSKLQDVSLIDLSKLCKGSQKTWPDGRNFTLVIHNPDSPEMKSVLEKIFGVSETDLKPTVSKLTESKSILKVVESDEEIIRTVGVTPGAVGVLDVYSINSAVKVLRIDGKLPFDAGYSLKGN